MPNQPMPPSASSVHSRRVGATQPRRSTSGRTTSAATSRRPEPSAPGLTSCATWRITTNAEAHMTSVTAPAATGSQVGGAVVAAGAGRSVLVVTGQD